jgi:hypothetical protein
MYRTVPSLKDETLNLGHRIKSVGKGYENKPNRLTDPVQGKKCGH